MTLVVETCKAILYPSGSTQFVHADDMGTGHYCGKPMYDRAYDGTPLCFYHWDRHNPYQPERIHPRHERTLETFKRMQHTTT